MRGDSEMEIKVRGILDAREQRVQRYRGKDRLDLKELSEEFTGRRISPGGCADLLAVTVFLFLVKRKFF